jgi:cyclopropane fatty-acyl-phospholipid synthase-like methyltransferase
MTFKRWFFFNLLYLRRPPWDTGVTPPEVVAFVQRTPPGRALDLGCGTGTNAIYLARHGWQVTGIDFVGKAIQQAQRKAGQAGVAVDFRVGDVTKLYDLSAPFNLVLDIGCFHSLREAGQTAYAANLDRWLVPGGTFLLYAFTRPDEETSPGPGISTADIARLESHLRLVERQEGADRGRPSAWLSFRR